MSFIIGSVVAFKHMHAHTKGLLLREKITARGSDVDMSLVEQYPPVGLCAHARARKTIIYQSPAVPVHAHQMA